MAVEDLIARLVLIERLTSWERLAAIEKALSITWPSSRVVSGALGNPMLPVESWKADGVTVPHDIGEFVVRGYVINARSSAPLPIGGSAPIVAVCLVQYPVPGPDSMTHELQRIAGVLQRTWGNGFRVEYGTARHPGLPVNETQDAQIMEFKIVEV